MTIPNLESAVPTGGTVELDGVIDRRKGLVVRLLTDPTAATCLVLLGVIALASALAPVLTASAPGATSITDSLGGPSGGHLLGFDGVGRDVLSRLLFGGRNSLLGTLFATVIAVAIGVPAGLVAGYFRGGFDAVMSWLSNLLQAVPAIILLLVVLAAIGQNTYVAMGVFGVLMSTGVYRLIRGSVTAVREELYVDAARVAGLSDARIIRRHVLPVVIAPTVILAAGMLGVGILIQSGLEFLGLGSNTEPSWGSMLNDAFANIYTKPSLLIWPGAAICLTVAAFSLLGNALSDVLVGGRPKVVKRRRGVAIPTTHGVASLPLSELRGDELLIVEDLRVAYPTGGASSTVVDGVSLTVRRGEVLGLVGESGSGKTQTAFAVLGLLPPEAHIDLARMAFDGIDLRTLSGRDRNVLRGRRIAYVPQEPMSNLDPSFKIGYQLAEPIRQHLGLSKAQAKRRALDLLERVGIADPPRVYSAYAHEISGGMAQRILIAGAVSCDPDLLIADEPTTALDVTVQAEVLDLMRSLQREREMGMILVTHDFGVVADICDTIAVMHGGRIVERASSETLFAHPQHEYTRMLLDATLEDAKPRERLSALIPAGGQE